MKIFVLIILVMLTLNYLKMAREVETKKDFYIYITTLSVFIMCIIFQSLSL